MSQSVTQNIQTALVTYILDTSNLPRTGLIFSDVTALYRKEGQSSFTSKTVTALNFDEIGNGVYTITFTGVELDTVGAFVWVVNGSGLHQFFGDANISPASVPSVAISVSTCVLTGHLADLDGVPFVGATVSAQILGYPTLSGQVGFTTNIITTVTDANGQFSLSVARNIDIDVIIGAINYRRHLTVPNVTTADLFTLP